MNNDIVELLCPSDETVVEEMIGLVATHFKDDHWRSHLIEFESILFD